MNLTRIKIPECFSCDKDMELVGAFRTGSGCVALFTKDNTPKWGPLKHVSISHQSRYPTWEEIREIKDALFGDIDVMMVLPKKADYVNIHKNCFHLWETPQEWGIK